MYTHYGNLFQVPQLQPRRAPPNLHFQKLNPHCDLEDFPTNIPTEGLLELASVEGRVSSGLSSFGFGGTNTHVVLEDATETVATVPATAAEMAPVFKRQSFAWQARRHALLSRALRTPEGAVCQYKGTPTKTPMITPPSQELPFGLETA